MTTSHSLNIIWKESVVVIILLCATVPCMKAAVWSVRDEVRAVWGHPATPGQVLRLLAGQRHV